MPVLREPSGSNSAPGVIHPQPGELVGGKYRIERILGEGGMGIVAAATHEHLGQTVALKFLIPAMTRDLEVVQRFMREARAAVKIQSEHVARVMDVGVESGAPYMVMEYLAGEDLGQLVARGVLPVEEAVGYVLQACEAVAEAHALGIVHRDLKPANLFLAERPSGAPIIKVLDFGVSKMPLAAEEVSLTSALSLMGSPGYMAPEQMRAAINADARSDIWSLGVVLYELLTGRLPFAGATMPELILAILHDPPIPIASLRGDFPPGFVEVLARSLEKDPAHRYADVAELARALAPFGTARSALSVERIDHVLGPAGAGRHVPAPARSSPKLTPSIDISIAVTATEVHGATKTFAPTTSVTPSPPRRRWLVALPALLVAVVTGALLFAARTREPVDGPAATSLGSDAPPASATQPSLSAPAMPTPLPPATGSPTAEPSAVPRAPTVAVPPRPRPSAAPAPKPTPQCRVVTSYDAEGNKHFKEECR